MPRLTNSAAFKNHAMLWQSFICIVIGITLIGSGARLSQPSYEDEPEWICNPPLVVIYSDAPQVELPVHGNILNDGMFALSIFPHEIANSYTSSGNNIRTTTVWVEVIDVCADFLWQITGNAYAAQSTAENDRNHLHVQTTNDNKGSSHSMLFKIEIDPERAESTQLQFYFDKNYEAFNGNGKLTIRLPIIDVENSPIVNEISTNGYDDSTIIKNEDGTSVIASLYINETPYYAPFLKVFYHYANTLSPSRYELNQVYPEPVEAGFMPRWETDYRIIPYVSYTDKVWERKQSQKTLWGGILIGIGAGVLIVPLSLYLGNKENEFQEQLINDRR